MTSQVPPVVRPDRESPIVVIGAGAAGFMAAIFARGSGERAGRRVMLLERTREGGRKIIMSGGGRCNVLPSAIAPGAFVTSSSPNTLKKLLLSWPLHEQQRFFETDMGIPLALEQETGKLFPVSNKSHDVRDGLRAMAERRGVEVRCDCAVVGIEPPTNTPAPGGPWRVRVDGGAAIEAARVIVATGGLSVPATGSDGTGLEIVRALGHTIHETYPALTPLTAVPHRYAALAGVSLTVALEAPMGKRKLVTQGGFLFTHKGYSGPSVLNISHAAVRSQRAGGARQPIFVQWSPLDADQWDRLLREGESTMLGILRRQVPARLAEALLEDSGVGAATHSSSLTRAERLRLVQTMTRHPLYWTGDEGYKRAEVTGGGVALDEIDPRTMESRLRAGLFLCGEILDAFGPIGGNNFAWAWATGRAAGLGAAR